MCGSMADIQSATAEIRRGKKDRRKKKKIEETTGQKYNGLPITVGGHNQITYWKVIGLLIKDNAVMLTIVLSLMTHSGCIWLTRDVALKAPTKAWKDNNNLVTEQVKKRGRRDCVGLIPTVNRLSVVVYCNLQLQKMKVHEVPSWLTLWPDNMLPPPCFCTSPSCCTSMLWHEVQLYCVTVHWVAGCGKLWTAFTLSVDTNTTHYWSMPDTSGVHSLVNTVDFYVYGHGMFHYLMDV